ncbi:calcium-activated chloride channel regulator 2 [Nephila pilipes]|uniref:Calcium-activated chloride channel regulator 2 n=1 Tax=Nephila pilipes TaxID=299642 RepID=A0A8X6TK92_NEPPI|nr:calcium-activated chloride channel regulator 2 [Nephila pilipes]
MMRSHAFLTVALSFCLCVSNASSIHIENNAYKGISISISENVEEQYFGFEKLKAVLTKSSEIIYHATKKRSYFGEFIISLPSSWNARMCSEFENKAVQKVDIHLTNTNGESDLGTKHSKGCGNEGDVIYMPYNWLNGNTEEIAQQFAQQWSIYRYGVFEEKPIKDYSCHLTENSWTPVGCYNIKVKSEATFKDGLPQCSLPSDFFEQNELQSSLMSISNFSNILHFCDGTSSFPHNPTMPTLHNNLCKGRTVWSVIENSNDFKHGINLPLTAETLPANPKFKCFREKPVQVTFAIQNNTLKTDLSETMIQMGSSLYEFLWNVAPKDSLINVVMFSDSNDTSKPLQLDVTDAKKLSEALEYHVKTFRNISNVCLSCGFQKALDAAHDSSPYPIIIFVVWESALIGVKPSVLVENIQRYSKNVRLHLVLVEDTEAEVVPTEMIYAIRSLGGLIYSLPKELVFMASKLQLILSNIVKNPLQLEDKVLVVHEANYHNISANFIDFFTTPSGAFKQMVYFMYCNPNRNSVIRSNNVNCTSLGRQASETGTFKCGEIREFTEEKITMKNWQYSFSYLGSTVPVHCSSVAMLLTSSSSSSSTNSFTMRGWLSEYVVNIPENVLIIYVEIIGSTKKFKVHAQISGPGIKSPVIIELRDNGNGDPDVNGFPFIEGNQQQKHSPSQKKNIGFFYVNKPAPDIDILPPNRVADLNVVSVNHENRMVELQWTAPGNDYDFGQASAYEIKYSQRPSSLSDLYFNGEENFIIETSNTLNPNVSGDTEVYEFYFPEIRDTVVYYIALRAVDGNNNTGDISNVVQIYLNQSNKVITDKPIRPTESTKIIPTDKSTSAEIPTITNNSTDTTFQTSDDYEISSSTKENNSTVSPLPIESDEFFDKKTIIVLSSAGGILLLIIIINIIICCCYIKKRRRSPESKKLSRKASLRPPYNINIAYQEESNCSRVSTSTLADQNEYTQPQVRNKTSSPSYSYHTSKSIEDKARKDSRELGFKLVQAQPAYATSSLSRYNARLQEVDSESETEFKSPIPQPQTPSSINDAQVYPLAKKYEIYFTEDWKDLQDSMLTKIQSKTLEYKGMPKPSGERELTAFQFPDQSNNTIYYIAMRASDASQNTGQLSNMIQVVIGVEKDPTANITGGNITGNGTETSTESIKIVSEADDYSKCYVIIGGLLGVILFIIIINIVIWATCFRKYKKKWEEPQNSMQEGMIPEKIKPDSNETVLKERINNHHSYANPAMEEYSAPRDRNEIRPNAPSPQPSVTYAQVIRKEYRNKDIYPLKSMDNPNFKTEYSAHRESDLGLV